MVDKEWARLAAEQPIRHPLAYAWTVQGFGMLRTYLDPKKKWRLNIWDSHLAVPNVSIIHDHPWDFWSWIVAGKFRNVRFYQSPFVSGRPFPDIYEWAVIKTGEGGGPDGKRGRTRLIKQSTEESYGPGDVYRQSAEEIHASFYEDGTVTLNQRTKRPDAEHARVFWPDGQNWVDAEPRPATPQEIIETVARACDQLEGR